MGDQLPENPYQSPAVWDEPAAPKLNSLAMLRYRQTLRSFRLQMHLLGGFWILIGGLLLLVIPLLLARTPDVALLAIAAGVGGLWMTLGVCACLKQMWAVYVGLVLSYLSLLGNLLQLRLCPLILVIVVIVIAHLAISKAGQLRRAGIALNTRPHRIAPGKFDPFEGITFEEDDAR